MKSEHSWLCLPESTTCSHPEPDKSSSPLPSYLMKVHFNIILLFMPIYCFNISYLSIWAFDLLKTNCILCRLFVCFPGVTTLCGCIFHSLVADFSFFILEVSWSHTTTRHSRQDSSGPVISPSQRPLPDNTQHSQQTSMPPVGFETRISAGERP